MEQYQLDGVQPSKETPWLAHLLRVRYQETDRMDVVFHGNYVTWFEIGRTEWIRSLGITYKQFEAQGLLLPVTGLQINYKRPAKYDDLVVVFTRISALSPIRMTFQSVVCRLDEQQAAQHSSAKWVSRPYGEELVEGSCSLAWVSGDNWRPKRFDREQPDVWKLLSMFDTEV